MEATKERDFTSGILEKVIPPRLEDAGLEDCALPPESIKEAFLRAATAVKSRATSIFSDDEDAGGCLHDPWPEDKDVPDSVVGAPLETEKSDALVGIDETAAEMAAGGPCVADKGGGVVEEGRDEVLVVGGGGDELEEREKANDCLGDEFTGLEIGDKKKSIVNGEESEEGIITGAAGSTVYYNLKLRHPTLDLPIIDYDLTLLLQPMLVLGICIGVALNVVFADWMITILLIIFFIATSTKSFLKGVETWKKETKSKKEASRQLESKDDNNGQLKAKPPLENSISETQTEALKRGEVSIIENVYRKELGLLVAVWLIILGLQIGKNYVRTCSVAYWALNTMQIPVAVGVTSYEALGLYKGQRKIASKGETITYWRIYQLVLFSALGLLAGIIGGMLGIGGGFILGPLFLEMGIPPQVSSATATFAMTFSASMSAIEYYLLKRFPVPYALYFFAVAIVAAFVGQHVVKKLISLLGRASIIIFVLAFTIFASTLLLGGIGIDHMIKKIQRKEYMGFESLCS
ncbi:hypothetical protein K2173_024635 [Erythroxylum novogranatense]|uniref:Sulfite exporter TauE/SafE family protein n=1 Tax=Erythroxylum novogranatense TaxID=1862640 RepID=A0AAV8SV55_9ROSI|nr:hypothetical protein K2173_024635 [Erythroxylum novogranatense]